MPFTHGYICHSIATLGLGSGGKYMKNACKITQNTISNSIISGTVKIKFIVNNKFSFIYLKEYRNFLLLKR